MSDVAKREDDKRWAVLRVEVQQQIDVKWQRLKAIEWQVSRLIASRP